MVLKISLSGAAGSGKSSTIEELVQRHNFSTADVGHIFRLRAREKGLTIAEYDKLIEKNPEEDKAMETTFSKLVQESKQDIIVSRRMWFHIIPDIISIWLDVSPEEWARRIFKQKRNNESDYQKTEEVAKANAERTTRHKQRMLDVYGVDFTDKKNYKHIIDTDGLTISETADKIEEILKKEYGFHG